MLKKNYLGSTQFAETNDKRTLLHVCRRFAHNLAMANFRIARQHGKQAVASWKPHSISIACAHSVPGRGILRTRSLGIPVQ
jgi:hypothetical protein